MILAHFGELIPLKRGELRRRAWNEARAFALQALLNIGRAHYFLHLGVDLAAMSGGVPAGANSPIQLLTSNPGKPNSATVGTSGNATVRARPIDAIARSLPAFTCGSTVGIVANDNCVWPLNKSAIAGELPL